MRFTFVRLAYLIPIGQREISDGKKRDEIRAKINASHRFGSFAKERAQNAVKWCVLL